MLHPEHRAKKKTFKQIIGIKYVSLIKNKIRKTLMNPYDVKQKGWIVVCCGFDRNDIM